MPYWNSAWEFMLRVKPQLPTTNVILIISMLAMMWYRYRSGGANSSRATRRLTVVAEDDFPPIKPLDNFKWETTEPIQLRPFKPKYNLTMALETLEPSELIPIDKEYKYRISERRKVLKEHHDIVVGIHSQPGSLDGDTREIPLAHDAICELYEFVMGIYLPNRYPTMFKLLEAKYESCKVFMLQNKVTGEVLPASVSPGRPLVNALETLAKTIDEDMLILLPVEFEKKLEKNKSDGLRGRSKGKRNEPVTVPSKGENRDVKYLLQAYVTCFPSGFNTREKLGKPLNGIHEPVPGYKEKLERSMDRYFEKLEVGKFVKRVNWGITTGAELFYAFGDIHSAKIEKLKPLRLEQLDLDDANILTLYPIRQLKEEGCGEDLAAAIEGLENGNVPLMARYKRVPVWGEAVKEYLRS
ncbi:hypothetical protein MferCBS31731_001221 [Microsporum ferrugineum]